jgi:hypothetical protein
LKGKQHEGAYHQWRYWLRPGLLTCFGAAFSSASRSVVTALSPNGTPYGNRAGTTRRSGFPAAASLSPEQLNNIILVFVCFGMHAKPPILLPMNEKSLAQHQRCGSLVDGTGDAWEPIFLRGD